MSDYLSAQWTGFLQMMVVSHLVEEGGVRSGYVVEQDFGCQRETEFSLLDNLQSSVVEITIKQTRRSQVNFSKVTMQITANEGFEHRYMPNKITPLQEILPLFLYSSLGTL